MEAVFRVDGTKDPLHVLRQMVVRQTVVHDAVHNMSDKSP